MGRSGIQYGMDRAAQGVTPQRVVDAWGLRHPKVDRLAKVVVVVIVAAAGWVTASWYGLAGGVLLGILVVVRINANHRRRLANGTSAAYGPPESKLIDD